MKYVLIMFFVAGLATCKAKVPTEAEIASTLPEGWVEDPFMECAPEEQVLEIFTSTDWVLDKVEGDLEQEEIERLQDVLYADPELTLIYVPFCFTLETYPSKNDSYLIEVSKEQVFYSVWISKYYIYSLISKNRLVNEANLDSYLYYTGKPRD